MGIEILDIAYFSPNLFTFHGSHALQSFQNTLFSFIN